MGLLDILRLGAGRSSGPPVSKDLFDDEFQRRLEMLAVVSRRVFAGRMRAEHRSKKLGSGVEFADHRDYVAGDDFRYVDWNVYQRFGKLLVRLYEEEEDLSIYFIVDCSTSMGFAGSRKLDQAKRLCAALAYVALANLDRVTIVAVRDGVVARMPTTRGKGRIFTAFQFLRDLEADGTTDLREALKTFVAQHKRRGLAVLMTDLYDPAGFEGGINSLRFNRFEPYVLHILDGRDARPEAHGDIRIVDCETGDDREVTVDAKLRSRVAMTYRDYCQSVRRFCTSHQIPYFAADVEVPFDELVLSVFRKGGFLR
jgi:uncharacterized protein (DUF58 family)